MRRKVLPAHPVRRVQWPTLPRAADSERRLCSVFKAANLDRGLAAAATSFCDGEVLATGDGRKVGRPARSLWGEGHSVGDASPFARGVQVSLSRIFLWYGGDFGATMAERLSKVRVCVRKDGGAVIHTALARSSAP